MSEAAVTSARARPASSRQAGSGVVNIGVVGGGLMGAFHAETLARRLPGVHLAGIADALPGVAEALGRRLGCERWATHYGDLLEDEETDAVVIAAPAHLHAEIIVAAARAGKAVFCEKPLANSLAEADEAIEAARYAGVPLQVGFQRRFDRAFGRARELVVAGALGSIQLLRSVTRDPALREPERVPVGGIFRETLIHDFDILRWLSGGAEPVTVFALADALIRPDFKQRGLLDSAVVTVRFDNGALATADASLQAVYGYDVRAEVFGSAGMVTVGDGRRDALVHFTAEGARGERVHWFLELFGDAYVAELAHFADRVRTGAAPACDGEDGRAALAMALAALRSVELGRPVSLAEVETGARR